MKAWCLALIIALPFSASAANPAIVDGVTFYDEPGRLYVPIRDVADQFGWPAEYDAKSGAASLNKRPLSGRIRQLADGKAMVGLPTLGQSGVDVSYDSRKRLAALRKKAKPDQMFYVRHGQKRVVVNKKTAQLAAWQGSRVVLRSHVTYGKAGKQTPNGIFKAQGYRAQMHRSSIYNNAPMPYAVQIVGNIFIHGFKNVPQGAGSNGCIRLPTKTAQWFYYWVDKGTPVTIQGRWPAGASASAQASSRRRSG